MFFVSNIKHATHCQYLANVKVNHVSDIIYDYKMFQLLITHVTSSILLQIFFFTDILSIMQHD